MKPFVIGLVLAVVVLGVGILLPQFLPSSISPTTLEALEKAELARRQLYAYNENLPLAGARSNLPSLRQADFDALVQRFADEFAALRDRFGEQVRQAKADDRKRSMPECGVRPLTASPAGVESEVGSFEAALSANQKLLAQAVQNSRAAVQADRAALGVGEIAGTVKLVEAEKLLVETRQMRSQLLEMYARAHAAAGTWAELRAKRDRYAELDVADVRESLNADLEQVGAALAEAQEEVEALTSEVSRLEDQLAQVGEDMKETRAARLTLEESGFRLGDTAAFEAYRAKYRRLSERLRELQFEQQLLTYGGIRGGVAQEDLLTGEIEGGETVVGLQELRRRLALSSAKQQRYAAAQKSLQDQLSLVGQVGGAAEAREKEYAARLDATAGRANQVYEEMVTLAAEAFEKEEQALRAARDAGQMFKSATAAVNAWVNEASSLQREKDPQRQNERLKMIAGDKVARIYTNSAEACAKTLQGRILTERALGLATYLDTLDRLTRLMPTAEFETTELTEQIQAARQAAVEVLSEARDAYQKLAGTAGETAWIHQSSLATVNHLLWLADTFNPQQHRSQLLDQLGKVVDNRRHSSYLQHQVALYDLLTGGELPEPVEEGEEIEPQDDEQAEGY